MAHLGFGALIMHAMKGLASCWFVCGVLLAIIEGISVMKYAIVPLLFLYGIVAVGVFVMHSQMPSTFWLAVVRSLFWPIWIAGGLKGAPLPMD